MLVVEQAAIMHVPLCRKCDTVPEQLQRAKAGLRPIPAVGWDTVTSYPPSLPQRSTVPQQESKLGIVSEVGQNYNPTGLAEVI